MNLILIHYSSLDPFQTVFSSLLEKIQGVVLVLVGRIGRARGRDMHGELIYLHALIFVLPLHLLPNTLQEKQCDS